MTTLDRSLLVTDIRDECPRWSYHPDPTGYNHYYHRGRLFALTDVIDFCAYLASLDAKKRLYKEMLLVDLKNKAAPYKPDPQTRQYYSAHFHGVHEGYGWVTGAIESGAYDIAGDAT
jgi:hypothetical protein